MRSRGVRPLVGFGARPRGLSLDLALRAALIEKGTAQNLRRPSSVRASKPERRPLSLSRESVELENQGFSNLRRAADRTIRRWARSLPAICRCLRENWRVRERLGQLSGAFAHPYHPYCASAGLLLIIAIFPWKMTILALAPARLPGGCFWRWRARSWGSAPNPARADFLKKVPLDPPKTFRPRSFGAVTATLFARVLSFIFLYILNYLLR